MSTSFWNMVTMPELSSVGKMCYISVSKNNITTKSDTTQQVESFME